MNFFSKSEWMAPAALTAVLSDRNGPGAHLSLAGGEKRHQAQQARKWQRSGAPGPDSCQPVAGQVFALRLRAESSASSASILPQTAATAVSGAPGQRAVAVLLLLLVQARRRRSRRGSARTASASAKGTESRGCRFSSSRVEFQLAQRPVGFERRLALLEQLELAVQLRVLDLLAVFVQALQAFLHHHQVAEDRVRFPRLRDRAPDRPSPSRAERCRLRTGAARGQTRPPRAGWPGSRVAQGLLGDGRHVQVFDRGVGDSWAARTSGPARPGARPAPWPRRCARLWSRCASPGARRSGS